MAQKMLKYPYFGKYFKLTAIDLSKQQKLDSDPKATQQINFTGYLEEDNTTMFFFIEKKTVLGFFKRNRESIVILFCFNVRLR